MSLRALLASVSGWSLQQKLAAAGVTAATLLLVVVVLAVSLGGEGSAEEIVFETPTSTPALTVTATATPRRTATPTATQTPGPGAEVLSSLRELVADYGYPEGANFARMRIPVLGVDAQVGSRYVARDGVMHSPEGPADLVWYDMAAWPGMGGAPGQGGNAIFAGHVDYAANVGYAGVYYRGQAVFSQLKLLSAGDIIEVDYGGQTYRYQVTWREQFGASGTSWGSVWSSDLSVDSITLYTCGGDFDFTTRSYSDRIVVRAERVP